MIRRIHKNWAKSKRNRSTLKGVADMVEGDEGWLR